MEEREGEPPTYRSDESVEKEHRVGLCRLGGGERRVARVGRVIFCANSDPLQQVEARAQQIGPRAKLVGRHRRVLSHNSLKVSAVRLEPSHRRSKH